MPQDGIIIYASQERPSVHIAPADYHLLAAVTFLKALRQVGLPKRPAPPRSTESVPHAIKRGDGVEKLTRSKVYAEVERLVGGGYASTDGKNGFGKDSWGLVVEVGDSWFSAIGVHLPQSTGFEMQFLYGSIGWSVGAYLGYALGIASGGKPLSLSGASPQAKSDQNNTKRNRVMAIVGDGSFQVGAQELSTAIRYGAAGVMMVVNNGGYAIEDQLHDGPYNRIQNWRFADLVSLFSSAPTALNPAHAWSAVCHTGADLERVMERVHGDPDGLALIEVVIPTDDVTKELAEWGGKVGAYTKRVG
ncbi:Thiamin diphosphate-binding protein [Gonapodya prolifera JEL478]|uniref:Thiamin diphosphate-binding protein n=1 Tax=Gonapodya prolifera (strain JEL478) TaxID=1344416 RepID=A0A139AQY0_GONPJ|nr:Thiamin diphosphate-binding protein [Gonapodya prolifera JEL478]|eukprot:KXS19138.1 Thiamin diphosphate-binding protein [Gonapodya prolifera JEL478]